MNASSQMLVVREAEGTRTSSQVSVKRQEAPRALGHKACRASVTRESWPHDMWLESLALADLTDTMCKSVS